MQTTTTVVVEADSPEDAYQKAVDAFYSDQEEENVETESSWLWTDVFVGEDDEEFDFDNPALHVDN